MSKVIRLRSIICNGYLAIRSSPRCRVTITSSYSAINRISNNYDKSIRSISVELFHRSYFADHFQRTTNITNFCRVKRQLNLSTLRGFVTENAESIRVRSVPIFSSVVQIGRISLFSLTIWYHQSDKRIQIFLILHEILHHIWNLSWTCF